MEKTGAHILYICHDGVIPPLGQSQVVNLLVELSHGNRISLLSFEKDYDLCSETFSNTKAKLAKAGIDWTVLNYHRRPTGLATLFDVTHGIYRGLLLMRRHNTAIVHARSYVPASIALVLKLLTGRPFIFDMRGFWADEKVDVGTVSRTSLPYRLAKRAETALLRNANVIASLSQAGVNEMRGWSAFQGFEPRFEVVSTYTNLALFTGKERLPAGAPFTVGYVGGAQGWYLIDPFLETFLAVKKEIPSARLLILNRYDHEFLGNKIREHGVPESSVELKAVEHDDVARQMARMSCAAFYIRPTYSKIASAPTKLGELLASGIPCLTNAGVGDVKEILEGCGAGVVVQGFSRHELAAGAQKLIALARTPKINELCRDSAEKHFSLEKGAELYRKIYASLS